MMILNYITLILLGIVVVSAFAIAEELKEKGYVKSRLFAVNLNPYFEGAKKLYDEGDKNIKFWVKLLLVNIAILVPLSLLELLLDLIIK
jgi:hypothetical protein